MSFSLCSLFHCTQPLPQKPEDIEVLYSSQKLTGIIDIIAFAAILTFAGLILANNAHCIQLSGLNGISNSTAYILLGASAAILLADLVIFAIQTSVKFQALAGQYKGHNSPHPLTQQEPPESTKKPAKELVESELKKGQAEKLKLTNTINSLTQKLTQAEKFQQTTSAENWALTKKLEEAERRLNESNAQLLAIQFRCRTLETGALPQNPAAHPTEKVLIPVQLKIDDARKALPLIEEGILYVTDAQAEMMKKDPYLKNFVTGQFIKTIDDGELFLQNLLLFFNPHINALCQQADTLGLIELQKKIADCHQEISYLSVNLGLTKDQAFIHHNGQAIGEGLQTVLNNLAHADMMGNEVLVLFWCQVLKQHMPFAACIEIFEDILETPLTKPEYLHEILFECLMINFNKLEAQTLLDTYRGKLKIKTLNLDNVLRNIENCSLEYNKANIAILTKILNIVDLPYIEILERGSVDFASYELKHLLSQFTQKVCLKSGREVTGRTVGGLSEVEADIPVIDLTGYFWTADYGYFDSTPDRICLQKNGIFIIYLVAHKDKVDTYLKIYYGTTLEELSQTK